MSLAGLSPLSIEEAVVRGFGRRCPSQESAAAPTLCDGSSCTCCQLSSPGGPFGAAAPWGALCPGGRLCGGRTKWPPVADLAWGLGFTCSWNQSLWIFLKRKVHQLSPEHGHFSNWENMQFSAPRKRHRGGSIAERAPSKSSLGWRPRRQLAPSPWDPRTARSAAPTSRCLTGQQP